MRANDQFVVVERTPPAVETGADNKITTSTCKETDKGVGPDITPLAIEMGTKIKSRLPVPVTPKVKAVVKLDKDETIRVDSPRAHATLTSKTMIPIFPATPRSKAVNKVGLSKSKHHPLSHTQNI